MSCRVTELGASNRQDNPIKKFYTKKGRKTAINAFCCYCMGCTAVEQGDGQPDHLEPSFRTEISNCSAFACPLFDYRPYQNKAPINKKGVEAAGTG